MKKGFSSSEEITFSLLYMLTLYCILYYFYILLVLVQCKETFSPSCLYAYSGVNQQKQKQKLAQCLLKKNQDTSVCLVLVASG